MLAAADRVVAPQLMIAEAVNAMWKYHRAGILSRTAAERKLRDTIELVDGDALR
jgi:hypothetical protein